MVYDIIIGRSEQDRKKFGTEGSVLLGKHYVKMGQVTSLSNKIYMDVTRSHAVFICGKRGSGKSYTMGAIAEGIADLPEEINQNIAVVMLDTMGIYWTMKYPNEKDKDLLIDWGFKGKGLNVQIFTPFGYYDTYKKKGIPTDFPFSIQPNELTPADWCLTFGIDINSSVGVFIDRIIHEMTEEKGNYSVEELIEHIEKDEKIDATSKDGAINRFLSAKGWGLFKKEGTKIEDLVKGGQVTVLDVSCYAVTPGAEQLRALVIGLVSQKLFIQRMIARKEEEFLDIKSRTEYLTEKVEEKKQMPMVWLIIDEAHEFMPNVGKTTASHALITILREGRQPGICLVLATQQPGKIHTDVMTQSDIVLSHRLTAKIDVDALGMLMQSYMREGLDTQIDNLPRVKGAVVAFDDMNERMYAMRVRPRITWHGGEAPTAMPRKKQKGFAFE